MWDTLKVPIKEKTKFICNPKYGSLHNYGAAVDISIVNECGKEIDMGTCYDYMGELAYPRLETKLLKEGRLTQKQIDNRILLRSVMERSGFKHIDTEWWHFNAYTRKEAQQKFNIVE
jgi:D-alanyl-D-alanine dipeptidase